MKNFKNFSLPVILWLLFGQFMIALLASSLFAIPHFLYPELTAPFHHSLHETTVMLLVLIGAETVILFASRVFACLFGMGGTFFSLWLWSRANLYFLLFLTPVSALLLWYGYDRLVPDYRFMNDMRPPYEHGLTWARFGMAWLIEIGIACAYWVPLRKLR